MPADGVETQQQAGGCRNLSAFIGCHEGFLIGTGPAFRKGLSLESNDLTDVAPTILALFGLSAPAYMDGKVLADAMTERPAA